MAPEGGRAAPSPGTNHGAGGGRAVSPGSVRASAPWETSCSPGCRKPGAFTLRRGLHPALLAMETERWQFSLCPSLVFLHGMNRRAGKSHPQQKSTGNMSEDTGFSSFETSEERTVTLLPLPQGAPQWDCSSSQEWVGGFGKGPGITQEPRGGFGMLRSAAEGSPGGVHSPAEALVVSACSV